MQEKNCVQKFKYHFSPPMLVFIIGAIALAFAGFGVSLWRFIIFLDGDISSPYDWIKFLLPLIASILLAVFVIPILFKAEYRISETQLIIVFGIIVARYDLKKIFALTAADRKGRMNVYFDEYKSNFIRISVKESWRDEFIRALTDRNESIEFMLTPPDEKKK